MKPPLTEFATRDAAMAAAADLLARAIVKGIAARGAAAAALSGGSTPEPAYALLAQRDLDWARVTVALVDERWAPPTSPASNEAMIRRALAPALAKGAKLLPLWSDAGSVEAGAARAEAPYAALALDAALMGMGADGHTASWFPGAAALEQALDPANPHTVMAITAPGAAGAAERLTLTRAALARAGRLILLITGADKRAVWEAAAKADPCAQPAAALIADGANKLDVLWAP
jgi:6-phosphogluconolactonase